MLPPDPLLTLQSTLVSVLADAEAAERLCGPGAAVLLHRALGADDVRGDWLFIPGEGLEATGADVARLLTVALVQGAELVAEMLAEAAPGRVEPLGREDAAEAFLRCPAPGHLLVATPLWRRAGQPGGELLLTAWRLVGQAGSVAATAAPRRDSVADHLAAWQRIAEEAGAAEPRLRSLARAAAARHALALLEQGEGADPALTAACRAVVRRNTAQLLRHRMAVPARLLPALMAPRRHKN